MNLEERFNQVFLDIPSDIRILKVKECLDIAEAAMRKLAILTVSDQYGMFDGELYEIESGETVSIQTLIEKVKENK